VAGATRLELATSVRIGELDVRRSEIDSKIRKSLMGQWFRGKGIAERYGKISDQELLDAIDAMKFENGDTEISR